MWFRAVLVLLVRIMPLSTAVTPPRTAAVYSLVVVAQTVEAEMCFTVEWFNFDGATVKLNQFGQLVCPEGDAYSS